MKKILSYVAVAALLALGIFRLLPNDDTASQSRGGGRWGGGNRSLDVIVEEVYLEPVRARLEAIGTSRASRSVVLLPRVGGEVTEVSFTAGDFVEKGDLLLALDARDEKLALELAKVRLEQAQRAYQRRLELTERGTTTKAATDEAEALRDEARIALAQAQVALDDRSIRAPFDGYVGATDVDVGDRITTTTEVTTIDDRSQLLVRFDVPETFIERLAPGETVSLEPFTAGLNDPTVAKIVDIGSRVDQLNRTFPARAMLDNAQDFYRPGQSFRITLEVQGERYASIPEVSLSWGSDGAYVWKVVDGRAKRVAATVVARRTGRVLIDGDFKSGDLIVSEGVQRVRDGFAVKGVNPQEDAPVLNAKRSGGPAETPASADR